MGAVLLAACGRPEISVYDAPKEETRLEEMPVADAGGVSAPVAWEAPRGWEELPPAPLRQAGYGWRDAEGKAEITVTAFPGDTGGLAANVNRWRRQLALPPLEEAGIRSSLRSFPSAAGPLQGVELSGEGEKAGQEIVAGILALPGESWFFKLSGDGAQVRRQKKAFEDMLRSVRLEQPQSRPSPAAGSGNREAKVSHETPAGWEAQPPGTMRAASFRAAGGVDISVVPLGPEAGSEADNVNRWRGQLQLEPLAPAALGQAVSDFKGASGTWRLVRLEGKERGITAAMLKTPQGTWFVKMAGPSGALAAQQAAFAAFVKSLRVPGAGP